MRGIVTACALALGISAALPVAANAASPAPPHISGLVVRPSMTSVALTWTDPRSSALHDIVIRRARGTHAPSSPSAGDRVAVLTPPAHSFSDSGLIRNATYTYALFTRNRTGGYSGSVTRSVRLAPSQAITGTVTGVGAVPLRNVHVTTLALDTAKAGPSATTRSDGTYRLDGLRADTDYQVCFDGTAVPGGPATGYATHCVGDPPPRVYVLSRGTRTGVNARLSVGAEIDGTVTDANGSPVAGVTLVGGPCCGPPPPAGIHTGSDGTYKLRGLVPGRYTLCFDTSHATGGIGVHGYSPQCLGSAPFDPSEVGAVSIPADTGVATNAGPLKLTAYRWITGKVTGPTGAPVAGVRVGVSNNSISFGARTRSDGTYLVRWEGNDADDLCFTPPASLHFDERCINPIPDAGPVDEAFTVPGGTGTLAGKVTDYLGHALPGVTVRSMSGDVAGASAVTGTDGRYRLPGLVDSLGDEVCFTPGNATQAVSPSGYLSKCVENVLHPAAHTTTLDAKLARGIAISGTARDTSGALLRGLLVRVDPADPFATWGTATTNSSGFYRVKGLTPGSWTVDFEADGWFGQNQSYSFYHGGPSSTGYQDQCWDQVLPSTHPCTYFDVTAGHVASGINARLRPAGAVSGTVTNTDGHPLRHVRVDIVKGYGYDDYEFTDAYGHYKGIELPVGGWAACFTAQDTSPSIPQGYQDKCYKNVHPPNVALTVSAGKVTSGIDMRLPAVPSGSVAGTVTDDQGQPVAGALVSTQNQSTRTRADGTYLIRGVPTGSTQVCAQRDGLTTVSAPAGFLNTCYSGTVDVASGQSATGVDIQLDRAGEIDGHVTDSGGAPLHDVAVSAFPQGFQYPLTTVYTDVNGDYRIPQLSGADYTLLFEPQFLTGSGTSDEGIETQWSGGTFDQSTATPVTANAGAKTTYDAALLEDGSISGTVRNESSAPFAGAAVVVESSDAQLFYYGTTGADGTYEVKGVRPGSYTVCFAVDGSATPYGATTRCFGDNGDGTPGPVSVTSAATTTAVDGTITRLGAIELTITEDGTGHPLSAYVTTQDSLGTPYSTWSQFDTGVADLTGLPPGDYTVHIDGSNTSYPGGPANGYADAQVMVTVAPAGQATRSVSLTPNPPGP